jgi:small-conductance mechanosensitive channel
MFPDTINEQSLLTSVAITLVIAAATYLASKWLRRQFEQRSAGDNVTRSLMGLLYTVVKVALYLAALALFFVLVLVPLGFGQELAPAIAEFLSSKGPAIALGIGVVFVGWIALKLADVFFGQLKISAAPSIELLNLIEAAVKILICAVAAIILTQIVFSALELPEIAGSVVTLFTVFVGVAVSFAATGSLGNFLAGLLLMSWRPFKPGDRVEVGGGVYGDLLEATLTHAKVKTIKDEIVYVPNLQVIGNKLINYSSLPSVILHTDITLGYDVSRHAAEEALLEAANETWGVMKRDRPPFVLIKSLDQYFVTYELNGFTDKPNQMVEIRSELHKRILDALAKRGIAGISPLYVRLQDSATPDEETDASH